MVFNDCGDSDTKLENELGINISQRLTFIKIVQYRLKNTKTLDRQQKQMIFINNIHQHCQLANNWFDKTCPRFRRKKPMKRFPI